MTFAESTRNLAAKLLKALQERGRMIVTAESCTGGLVAAALTAIPGSSAVVLGGFVTYANRAKTRWIGVPEALIERAGAVSAEVARAMAEGARNVSGADLSIAVTGIAGPSGATPLKPVGLVHFACTDGTETIVSARRFGDIGRDGIRQAAVYHALELALRALRQEGPA